MMCKQHVHRPFVGGDVWETSKMINFFKALQCLVVPGLFEFEKKGGGWFWKKPCKHHRLSVLWWWRMRPSIRLLQAIWSFVAISATLHVAILDVLSPRWSFFAASLLASLLRSLPSGAHASSILGFWSEDLRMLSSHIHPVSILALKNNARSVNWKRMLVSRREEYHAYTYPEKTNFLMHERVKTRFGPVPNYPHTPLKVKWATPFRHLPAKITNFTIFLGAI